MKDTATGVRIGCFGGFWGDSMAHAVGQFLRSREAESLDYLVSDYLAEVTMCILAKKKKAALAKRTKQSQQPPAAPAGAGPRGKPRVETAGAIDDFALGIWRPMGQQLMQKGIKVVVNAGGLDPLGLKAAVEAVSAAFPEAERPVVAAVLGDDLLAVTGNAADVARRLKAFKLDGGDSVDHASRPTRLADGTETPLPQAPLSANAYIGCGGIAQALRAGAHVVITGRVVDSAMVLGPLVHEHGWALGRDWDRLAAGTAAGHVIECGAQCTGGNFTDWELGLQMRGRGGRLFENIGFPFVDVLADGTFTVGKPSGTGGIVSRLSVAEQLVYEIGDPTAYYVADVVCDFSGAKLEETGKNRVTVSGVRGRPATGDYKVTATFADGYMGHFTFAMAGPGALYKARAVAQSIVRRSAKTLAQLGQPPFRSSRIEYLGAREMTANGGCTVAGQRSDEVVVRISVHHDSPKMPLLVAANIPSASTGMAPGLFALTSARPAPSEAVALRSSLVAAADVPITVAVGKGAAPVAAGPTVAPPRPATPLPAPMPDSPMPADERARILASAGPTVRAPLVTVACCRSGDKADAANVGVVCRKPEYLPFLQAVLTPEVVQQHLAAWFDDAPQIPDHRRVHRFTLPGPAAMNFVLSHVLGGGGLASLKADKQGKSIGSLLSGLQLELPQAWVADYEATTGSRKAEIRAKL